MPRIILLHVLLTVPNRGVQYRLLMLLVTIPPRTNFFLLTFQRNDPIPSPKIYKYTFNQSLLKSKRKNKNIQKAGFNLFRNTLCTDLVRIGIVRISITCVYRISVGI